MNRIKKTLNTIRSNLKKKKQEKYSSHIIDNLITSHNFILIDSNMIKEDVSDDELDEWYRQIIRPTVWSDESYTVFDIRKFYTIHSDGGRDTGIPNSRFPEDLYDTINKCETNTVILTFNSKDIGEKYLTDVIKAIPNCATVLADKELMLEMQFVFLRYLVQDL